MTLAELRYALGDLDLEGGEAAGDREVLVRTGPGRLESIPFGNVEWAKVSDRPAVVIDLTAGR
jgi:hypothetical protein